MKSKLFFLAVLVSIILSMSAVTFVSAAGTITLSSTSVAAGGTVTVSGSGFGNAKAVGIALGNEVAGSNANMAFAGTGTGPYTGTVSKNPIKPGTFVLTSDTGSSGIVSTYTDRGDGTTTWSYDGTPMGTINYVTGAWGRSSTVDVTGIAANYSAVYTTYQYSVTPAAGITTSATGTFSATITIPSTLTNGDYTVTAIDAAGNKATSTLTVSGVIPENFSLIAIVLLSTMAIAAGLLWKKPSLNIARP